MLRAIWPWTLLGAIQVQVHDGARWFRWGQPQYQWWVNPAINDWGTIDYSWLIMVFIMVYFMEKPKQKWMMMTGSTPMDWKPPYDWYDITNFMVLSLVFMIFNRTCFGYEPTLFCLWRVRFLFFYHLGDIHKMLFFCIVGEILWQTKLQTIISLW